MGCSDGGVRFRTDLKCMIIISCAGDFIQAEIGPLRYIPVECCMGLVLMLLTL